MLPLLLLLLLLLMVVVDLQPLSPDVFDRVKMHIGKTEWWPQGFSLFPLLLASAGFVMCDVFHVW